MGFYLKNNPPDFFVFLKRRLFFFFKETGFCNFLRKTQKLRSEMQYHHFQNYTVITCYIMELKFEVTKCTPSLFSQSVVGKFSPKW